MLGFIGFFSFEKENHRAEIGYMLFPENFRKGIMLEALEAVVQFGFNSLNLHSIAANINPLNTASAKLLEKADFKKEAYFRENYYFNGKFLDSIIYCRVKAH
jgi:ribosomal-protein-alanine N-acetyltransferase